MLLQIEGHFIYVKINVKISSLTTSWLYFSDLLKFHRIPSEFETWLTRTPLKPFLQCRLQCSATDSQFFDFYRGFHPLSIAAPYSHVHMLFFVFNWNLST